MTRDLASVGKTPKTVLGKVLALAKEVVLEGRQVTETDIEGISKEYGVEKAALLSGIRIFQNLVGPFMSEPSADRFQEELIALGLDSDRARIVKDAFVASRDLLKAVTKDTFRERFGPVVSEVRWRVDRVESSSDPLDSQPLGVIGITFETAHETFDQTFEVNLEDLDKLLERLTALRRELTKKVKATARSNK